jgi:hypothetical protein
VKTLALVVLLALAASSPAHAYLKLGALVDGAVVDITWRGPVRYFISDRGTSGVSATQLRDAVARAAATWSAVESANVEFGYLGLTSAVPDEIDGRATIGFMDRPDLEQVLGATSFLIDITNGDIVEADIFFNTQFQWSVSATGTPGRVDLESVALHELGHLLGLSHSALGMPPRSVRIGLT